MIKRRIQFFLMIWRHVVTHRANPVDTFLRIQDYQLGERVGIVDAWRVAGIMAYLFP